jgi:hypothetical protein
MRSVRAGWYVFNEKALIPSDEFPWDAYESCLFRYAMYEAYDTNTAYDSVQRFSTELKRAGKLYNHVRGVYNPVSRLKESYVDKIYGGALDFETLETGAIPLVFVDDANADVLRDALRNVWLESNLRLNKDLYVRQGALLGDVAWKVVDDPQRGKVRMEILHPGKIKEFDVDAVHNVKRIVIEYERDDPETGRSYLYTEEIDKERFTTYKDGVPFAFEEDREGQRLASWPNVYGFVPVVLVQHRNVGRKRGANAFYAQIGKIDELNDSASLLGDAVRKGVNPMLRATGLRPGTKVEINDTERDEVPILYIPEGATLEPLAPQLDAASAGVNIDRLLLELERDLPELALHRLREGGNLTAPGVRSAYSDAVGRFRSAMSAYDDGLIRAQKMALSIGGFRGYEGFAGITLESYAAGELEHYIKDRPIIEDALSKLDRITILSSLSDRPEVARLVLEELSFSQQQIDDILATMTETAERQTRAAVRGMADAWFGGAREEGDDGDEQPEPETEAAPETPTVAA